MSLNGLQCVTPGNCTAVGTYYDRLNHGQAVAWTQTAGRWTRGTELAAPSNAKPNAFDTYGAGGQINGLSCSTAGNCAAVGDYIDQVRNARGVLFSEHNGHWSHGIGAQMPSDSFDPAQRGPNGRGYASIPAVSCVPHGNCVAVGLYLTDHGAVRSVLFVDSNGSWGPVKVVPPPTGGLTGDYENAQLNAVSCAADGTCTAVGSYTDSADNVQGWAVTIHGGKVVTSRELPMPSGPDVADPSPSPLLYSVSCVNATDCAAGGNYSIDYNGANTGNLAGLLLVEHAGTWQATEAQLPANAAPINVAYNQDTALMSVDCADTSHCSAVGYYSDNNSNIQGEVMEETSGTWTTPQQVALPGNASTDIQTQLVLPGPVACSSAGFCAASSVYAKVTGSEVPLLAIEPGLGQPWSSTAMVLPANASVDQEVGGLAEVSCPALNPPAITTNNDCTVLGVYQDVRGNIEGFATTQNPGGTWGRPTELAVPRPTRADVRETLALVLRPKRHKSSLRHIRKHHGYSFHYRSIEGGTLTITWRIHHHHHLRVFARVRIRPKHKGRFLAKVHLTRLGHRLKPRGTHIRVRCTVTFRHKQQKRVIARSRFTIHK